MAESKSKQLFVVEQGEEFVIHVAGPVRNVADPTGVIGGSSFDYTADRAELIRTRAYTTDHHVRFPKG